MVSWFCNTLFFIRNGGGKMIQLVIAVATGIGLIWFIAWFLWTMLKPEETDFYHKKMLRDLEEDETSRWE